MSQFYFLVSRCRKTYYLLSGFLSIDIVTPTLYLVDFVFAIMMAIKFLSCQSIFLNSIKSVKLLNFTNPILNFIHLHSMLKLIRLTKQQLLEIQVATLTTVTGTLKRQLAINQFCFLFVLGEVLQLIDLEESGLNKEYLAQAKLLTTNSDYRPYPMMTQLSWFIRFIINQGTA